MTGIINTPVNRRKVAFDRNPPPLRMCVFVCLCVSVRIRCRRIAALSGDLDLVICRKILTSWTRCAFDYVVMVGLHNMWLMIRYGFFNSTYSFSSILFLYASNCVHICSCSLCGGPFLLSNLDERCTRKSVHERLSAGTLSINHITRQTRFGRYGQGCCCRHCHLAECVCVCMLNEGWRTERSIAHTEANRINTSTILVAQLHNSYYLIMRVIIMRFAFGCASRAHHIEWTNCVCECAKHMICCAHDIHMCMCSTIY